MNWVPTIPDSIALRSSWSCSRKGFVMASLIPPQTDRTRKECAMQPDHSDYHLQVRDAVLSLALTIEPDELYDPADDPRPVDAMQRLTQLLDSPEAALAVGEALSLLYQRWHDHAAWGPAIGVPAPGPE